MYAITHEGKAYTPNGKTELVESPVCRDCGKTIERPENSISTGYAVLPDNSKICYECSGKREKQAMIDYGRATLYLSFSETIGLGYTSGGYIPSAKVSDWPSSIMFKVNGLRKSHHNIARYRYDVWFNGPDGHIWHGTQYGDNTQIVHCKRTKTKWR